MTRAVDPFEEFLRKKKVEMLEQKVRKDAEDVGARKAEPEEEADESWAPVDQHANPAADQRMDEEMAAFFERGADAGAELFAQAQEIDEDRVDEIKDALEDVFEAEQVGPEVVAPDDDTFIDFFKEVQTSFDPDLADLRREQNLAREVVQTPPEGAFEDEPLTAEFPPPEPPTAGEPEVDATLEPEPEPMPVTSHQPFMTSEALELEADPLAAPEHPARAAVEALSANEEVRAEESQTSAERLKLMEILAPLQEGEDLRRRVDVLSRLVVKLVERSELSESELIEVLIKSGVGF